MRRTAISARREEQRASMRRSRHVSRWGAAVGVGLSLAAADARAQEGSNGAPAAGPLPPLPPSSAPSSSAPPSAYPPPSVVYAPPPPPVYAPPPPPPLEYAEPERPAHAPKFSLWVGARLGFTGFGGAFYTNELGQGETTGNFVKNGPSFQLDVGARLGRRYIPFFFYERAALGAGHRFEGDDASAYSELKGFGFRHVGGDVDTAGFVSELSVGLRTVSVSRNGSTYKMSTLEFFRLGLGAEIRITTLFTISPMATIATGVMTDAEGTVSYSRAGSGDGVTRPTFSKPNGAGTTIDDQRGYVVVGLGVGAHFDVFGK